jgi:acyl-lipid omega-6 desaturase (Delta-12 desaturase)
MLLSSMQHMKAVKRDLNRRYARGDDGKALTQVLTTLGGFGLAWGLAVWSVAASLWLTAAAVVVIALFTLRVFALMHDCGHRSLFRTQRLNRAFGFALGVVTGMPQYVWSQHHDYHHLHNGNWEVYRGPYATPSVGEYAAMTDVQQRFYRLKCHLAAAPFVGFVYLIFNPRFTWLKGSLGLAGHVMARRMAEPDLSLRSASATFKTRYWQSAREYRHILWNNVVLLSVWALMCWGVGPVRFFAIYVISVSLAGGAGILLFAVQHNFEHAYASDTKSWDRDVGAIHGTSFVILPSWLNWFTANIGYHHIHHLSAHVPNYRLVRCHAEYEELFADVTRLKLRQVRHALKYMLWDPHAQRIISIAEYRQQLVPSCSGGFSTDRSLGSATS